MSGGLDVLALKEDDVTKMLAACTHLGSENVNFQMEQYVYKRRVDGEFSTIFTSLPMLFRENKSDKYYRCRSKRN